MDNNFRFYDKLREEIINSQERRASFVRQKFTFVCSFVGLGSISLGSTIDTSTLLYIAPVMSFAFDLYILGEDFGIKRAGGFLGRQNVKSIPEESEWENLVRNNRDPFSRLAGPLLSILVLVVSGITLIGKKVLPSFFILWIIVNFFCIAGIHFYCNSLNKKIHKFEARDGES